MARETNTFLGYPFDSELFMQMWSEVPDTRLAAMIQSSALVTDSAIAAQIGANGNYYTIPFYNTLEGDEDNYDGMTDITQEETTATSQSGIVYGRAKSFTARNFQAELSGADPMGHIAQSVAAYWNNKEQKRLIGIISGIFSTTDSGSFASQFLDTHVLDTGAPVDITDANRLMTKSLGDNKSAYSMAIMHSNVAERLENEQVLEFWKQTDANGLQRPSKLASWNGLTVIVDDGVPVTGDEYTTYLFGTGALRTANGRLDVPIENDRNPLKFGGQDFLVTRIRKTIHPNGFSYIIPATGFTESPTDAQLFAGANWKVIFDPKAIPIGKLITTETVI
jgi:hypothetical protein